jgi:hypothetical protein
MARRKRKGKSSARRRPSTSQIALFVLSLIIVLSMVIGFVVSVLPTPTVDQTVITATPTVSATTTQTHTPTLATEEAPSSEAATPQPDQ